MTPPNADFSSDRNPKSGKENGPIDLSATPSFRLGGLEVRPSTREVHGDSGAATLAEPRVLQVLVALARAEGAVVSRDQLIQQCWEGRIVGEDAINRSIAKARQLAELTTPPAFVIETVPRVGYRLRLGAPDTAPSPSAAPVPDLEAASLIGRRALWLGGLVAGGAAAAGGAWWLTRSGGPRPDPLVAVLPFDNLSPDAQMGYFADGLSEDILNALIRGGGVRVTSRSSSFTFRGPAKAKAGETLKANYLLDGSVLREGTRLRVNAHLSDVATQQTLWSESYDRDVGQGLQIEDEVAGQVASALKVQFASGAGGARTIDPVAYDLYLKGRAATREHSLESIRRGGELLHAAVERAPNFSAAWFELAENYFRSGFVTPLPQQLQGFERGRQAAQRAFALDPRNGAAYGILAELGPRFNRWAEIEAIHKRGMAISPNDPDLMLLHGAFLTMTGRLKAAIELLRRGQALDPLEMFPNHTLWGALNAAGRFEEAEAIVDRIAAIWPDQVATYWDRFWLLASSGREVQATAWLARPGPRRDVPEEYAVLAQGVLASISGSSEDREAAGRACLRLARLGMGYAANGLIMLGKLGQSDPAVRLAEALYLQKGDVPIDRNIQFLSNHRFPPHGEAETNVLFHPFLAPLRKSGRLNPVFDGIGLTAFWKASGPPDA